MMPEPWQRAQPGCRGSSLYMKRKDQGGHRAVPKHHSGRRLCPLLLGWQDWDLEGFSLRRRKLSDSFSGDCWISPCRSAGWSFLTKGRWHDGLSRAVASAQCKSSELEQRSCPTKPGLFATKIPASNCSFNDLYDRQRKHRCLLSLL